ncbi:MAG: hypothetical protein QF632_02455 [Candidatus Woesearchaeota archaeon]|nr:hypothetical protein [Candidatus Woesearchaeota archaeon]MDP7458202.1 hypothetical protein [Candidatus Woesearchaeota archaeon]
MAKKKGFFTEPTAAKIKELDLTHTDSGFIGGILDLQPEEALVIQYDLVPKRFKGPNTFKKYGPVVTISNGDTSDGIITPAQLREKAVNDLTGKDAHLGYSYTPTIGADGRPRRVSIIDCLEGARIFHYAHPPKDNTIDGSPIEVERDYGDSGAVPINGATLVVTLPSRTKGHPRYSMRVDHVPISDSKPQLDLASCIATDHICEASRYKIRHGTETEPTNIVDICAHEVAAYLAIAEHYQGDKNPVPWDMNPFATPTELALDFYRRLERNVLIQTPEDQNPRKPNQVEKAILLMGLVQVKGHEETLNPSWQDTKLNLGPETYRR